MGGILDTISDVKNANNPVETELDWERGELGCEVSFGKIILQL